MKFTTTATITGKHEPYYELVKITRWQNMLITDAMLTYMLNTNVKASISINQLCNDFYDSAEFNQAYKEFALYKLGDGDLRVVLLEIATPLKQRFFTK